MYYRTLLILLISLMTWSIQSKGQSEIIERKITFHADSINISDLLDRIGEMGNINFSYDADVVKSNRIVSIHQNNVSIEDILLQLFKEQNIAIEVLKNQVILKERPTVQKPPTPKIILEMNGKILDRGNGRPIPYVNITVKDKFLGTISNMEGDFLFKLDPELKNDTIIFSCLGYHKVHYRANDLVHDHQTILMNPLTVQLKEIQVTKVEPEEVIERVIANIATNYPDREILLNSYYREIIKVDKKYSTVSEAIMDILKYPAFSSRSDRVKIVKGRQNDQVEKVREVKFKFMGGPFYINKLDIIRNSEEFINKSDWQKYKYELEDVITIRERPTYIIKFKPEIMHLSTALFEGKLYVDAYSFAITRAQYQLTKEALRQSRTSFIKRISRNLKARPITAQYEVSYIKLGSKWHLNTAHNNVKFKVRSKNQLINSTFHARSEILITDRNYNNILPFHREEVFRSRFIFADMLDGFDNEFWGQYNTIQPEEDLRKAINRFNNRVKKNGNAQIVRSDN
ncbi:hypothetical protein EYV94_17625 [Puteibacter caeruleilacunae]|nr:hypothetical protein EYV94_17625 [Puteibacter caeruleilacunae]